MFVPSLSGQNDPFGYKTARKRPPRTGPYRRPGRYCQCQRDRLPAERQAKTRQDKTRQDTASTLNSQTFSCSSDEACVSVPSLSWHTDDRSLFSTRKRFCVRDSNKQKVRKGACFFPAGRTEQVNMFASISLSSVRSPCQKHAAPCFRSALSPCFSPVCLGRLMQFWY